MVPAAFTNFFLASAGAGAALVGLLFVAVSIAPESTVMRGAPVERQAVAASAYTALLNAFFISLGALIPVNVGYFAVVMGLLGLVNTVSLGRILLRQLHGWLNLVRRMFLVVGSLVAYGFEVYYAWLLLQASHDVDLIYSLSILLLCIYALGLTRAWQLLGAKRDSLLGWLSPLHDIEEEEKVVTQATD